MKIVSSEMGDQKYRLYEQVVKQNNIAELRNMLYQETSLDNKFLLTVMSLVVWHQNVTMAKILITEFNFDVNYDNYSIIRDALYADNSMMLEFFITYGINIHEVENYALIYSSFFGHVNVMKFLLELGIDPNVGDGEALIMSARNGKYESVKLLVQYGANVHLQDDKALLVATKYRHYEIVQLLLDNGADVTAFKNVQNNNENTSKYEKIFQLIVSYGADPFSVTKLFLGGHI